MEFLGDLLVQIIGSSITAGLALFGLYYVQKNITTREFALHDKARQTASAVKFLNAANNLRNYTNSLLAKESKLIKYRASKAPFVISELENEVQELREKYFTLEKDLCTAYFEIELINHNELTETARTLWTPFASLFSDYKEELKNIETTDAKIQTTNNFREGFVNEFTRNLGLFIRSAKNSDIGLNAKSILSKPFTTNN